MKKAEKILKVKINVDKIMTTEAAKVILKYLSNSQSTELPAMFTMSEIANRFKNWTEETTTSPSGRHLGTYKATIQHTKKS